MSYSVASKIVSSLKLEVSHKSGDNWVQPAPQSVRLRAGRRSESLRKWYIQAIVTTMSGFTRNDVRKAALVISSDILLSATNTPLRKNDKTRDHVESSRERGEEKKDSKHRHLLQSSGISFWDIPFLWPLSGKRRDGREERVSVKAGRVHYRACSPEALEGSGTALTFRAFWVTASQCRIGRSRSGWKEALSLLFSLWRSPPRSGEGRCFRVSK